MAKRLRSITILVVLALLLLAVLPGDALAAPSRTKFSGTDQYLYDLEPGEEYFTDDGIYHIRDNVALSLYTASDPRVNGYNTFTFNGDFELMPEPVYVMGVMWGTFILENDGGAWEGTYTGYRDKHGYSRFWFVGIGGGGYEGLRLEMSYKRLDPDPIVPGDVKGFIIEI